jgi:hypothetical protein
VGSDEVAMKDLSDLPPVVMVGFSLLGSWFCAHESATEAQVIEAARSHGLPAVPDALVRDRLYGGFKCQDPTRRHIALDSGAYTYCDPNLNRPNTRRGERWAELIEASEERGPYIGGGLFSDDAPASPSAASGAGGGA